MAFPDHEGRGRPDESAPLGPITAELPADLAAFLAPHERACLLQETTHGTAFVIKLPSADIENVRGRLPVHLRHELYAHPAAPVIRTVLTLYDQPDAPLAMETFTNVAEADQRADFAGLATQDRTVLLFYDESLTHQLTKVIAAPGVEEIERVLATAQALAATIPAEQFDFDRAKQAIVTQTML